MNHTMDTNFGCHTWKWGILTAAMARGRFKNNDKFLNDGFSLYLAYSQTNPYCITDWWFGTFLIFPYIGKDNPNWLIFFQRGWNHQPDISDIVDSSWFHIHHPAIVSPSASRSTRLWPTRVPLQLCYHCQGWALPVDWSLDCWERLRFDSAEVFRKFWGVKVDEISS